VSLYTAEQRARRDASPWTMVQAILGPIQFLAFVVSFALVIRYLTTGEGYFAASVSVFIKIALLWAITLTGMVWEKEIFGHWFMAKAFFWEDLGNLIALIVHNTYFVALLAGWPERSLMTLMLAAYCSYLVNCAQFISKGIRAARERRAPARQSLS
jgi:3-vinyl bacteriochlorophyllide hydratase